MSWLDILNKIVSTCETLSRKVMDDNGKKNIHDASAAGLETRVVRSYDDVGLHDGKDECKWCKSREGDWSYREAVRNGVFERHPGCECTIDYVTSRGTQRQTNWRYNTWEDVRDSDIIRIRKRHNPDKYDPDIYIGKSLSAAFKDTAVRLPDGDVTRLTPGEKIERVQTIAGMGRRRKIDEIDGIIFRHQETAGSPELWKKQKGFGYVDYEGESYRVELHWYNHPLTGNVEYKIKPDAGGNWFYGED